MIPIISGPAFHDECLKKVAPDTLIGRRPRTTERVSLAVMALGIVSMQLWLFRIGVENCSNMDIHGQRGAIILA